MTPSQRDRIVRMAVKPIVIHPLGKAALLPKQNRVLVTRRACHVGVWWVRVLVMDGIMRCKKDFCDQICLRNASYSFLPWRGKMHVNLLKAPRSPVIKRPALLAYFCKEIFSMCNIF